MLMEGDMQMKISLSSFLHFSKNAKVFLLTEICFGFATGLLSVHLNFYLRSAGLEPYAIGHVSMAGAIATALFALVASRFSNRRGYYPVCMLGGLMQGFGLFAVAASDSMVFIISGQVLYAVGLTCIHAVEFPYVTAMTEPEHKSSAYFYLILVFSISSILGNVSGGWVLNMNAAAVNPYRLSILASGGGFVLLTLLRLKLPNIAPAKKVKAAGFWKLLTKPNTRWFFLYHFGFAMTISLLSSMLNLIYKEVFGFADVLVGQLFSGASLLTFLALLILPGIVKRRSADHVAILSLAALVLIFALSIAAPPPLFAALALMRAALSQVFPVVIESRMLAAIPPENQGTYAGLRILSNSIGQGIGANITGYLLSFVDYRWLMLCGVVFAAGNFLLYTFRCRPNLDRPAEKAL